MHLLVGVLGPRDETPARHFGEFGHHKNPRTKLLGMMHWAMQHDAKLDGIYGEVTCIESPQIQRNTRSPTKSTAFRFEDLLYMRL